MNKFTCMHSCLHTHAHDVCKDAGEGGEAPPPEAEAPKLDGWGCVQPTRLTTDLLNKETTECNGHGSRTT